MNEVSFLSRLFDPNIGVYYFQSANEIQETNRMLVQKIKDRDSSFDPDLVVSVFRGGLYALRVALDYYFTKAVKDRNYYVIDVSRYTGIQKTGHAGVRQQLPDDVELYGKTLLLIEDLSDFGVSLYMELHHIYSKLLQQMKKKEMIVSDESARLEAVLSRIEAETSKGETNIPRTLKTELQSSFGKYCKVVTACAYIKPWTSFIPDFYKKLIPAWIANSYEEQEIVYSILNDSSKTEKQKRAAMMRTGISGSNLDQYLKNFNQKPLSFFERLIEHPLQRWSNSRELRRRMQLASEKFDPTKLSQHPDEFK